jgi:hypothetical protein
MPNDTLTAVERLERTLDESVVGRVWIPTYDGGVNVAVADLREVLALAKQARPEPVNERLVEAAREVMDALEQHGPSIVPHLIDTDDNAGERLRTAITEATNRMGDG